MLRSWTLLLFMALAWSAQSSDTATAQLPQPEPGPGCTAATQELSYPTYWLGPSFRGHEVSAVLLECEYGWTTVTYLYGDCTSQGGGCPLPLDIQNYPPELRNKEMYSEVQAPTGGPSGTPPPPPPGIGSRGTDTTIDGVPATNWGGHIDVYREETTVAIFSEGVPRAEVAKDLIPAPVVPATLARFGLYFDRECVDVADYCEADRSLTSKNTEILLGILFFYGPALGLPFLAGLIFGRAWTLSVAVPGALLVYAAGSLGWIATGEIIWQIFIPYLILGGVVSALVGVWIHTGLASRKRGTA